MRGILRRRAGRAGGGRAGVRGHLRREESLRQNRNPRRSTVRMAKECLMCILCPCSLFFGPDCRKNLLRESRFCLRLSIHSCGIVRGPQPSLPQLFQPAAAEFLSPGYGKVPRGRFTRDIELTKMITRCKVYNSRPSLPVFRECEGSLSQDIEGSTGETGPGRRKRSGRLSGVSLRSSPPAV